MAPYTYYYFFSIMLVFTCIFYAYNIRSIRSKGKTVFGQEVKVGTPERKRFDKQFNGRHAVIFSLVTLVSIINLAYSITRIVGLHTPDARFLLWFAPIFLVVLFVVIIYVTIHLSLLSGRRK